jgi:glyceraldehyde 3-phosphate dehydrogenase
VSSDVIQEPFASIIDLDLTQVVDGDLITVMSWYDNEWGYASQMVREARRAAKPGRRMSSRRPCRSVIVPDLHEQARAAMRP